MLYHACHDLVARIYGIGDNSPYHLDSGSIRADLEDSRQSSTLFISSSAPINVNEAEGETVTNSSTSVEDSSTTSENDTNSSDTTQLFA